MRALLPTWTLVGREVYDVEGHPLGKVVDTHPPDGGGEPDLVLVHVGRKLPRRRWLPLAGCVPLGESRLLVKWARWQIEDGPDAGDHRWGNAADVARAYWLMTD